MADAVDKGVFKDVGERAVPDVVHQDGGLDGLGLVIGNRHTLGAQAGNGFAHQVVRSHGVLEAGVLRTWIDKR